MATSATFLFLSGFARKIVERLFNVECFFTVGVIFTNDFIIKSGISCAFPYLVHCAMRAVSSAWELCREKKTQ